MRLINDLFAKYDKRKVIGLFLVIVLMIIVILAPAIKHQLNAWKLLPQPEQLTELYLTSPNTLPSTYTPNQSQTISFTVHNLEYQTTTYSYTVTEASKDGNTTQLLASNNFTIDQNQYKTTALQITPIDLGSNVKISVALKSQNESIDYLLTKATP